jgi:hypothetical protein
VDIEQCTIWIDILFVNQNSSDIKKDLLAARHIYQHAEFHLVIMTNLVLTRAWCLFELYLRGSADKEFDMVRISAPETATAPTTIRNYFEEMKAFSEGDRLEIQDEIVEKFGGSDRFNEFVSKIVERSSSQCSLFGRCCLNFLLFFDAWSYVCCIMMCGLFCAVRQCIHDTESQSARLLVMFPDDDYPPLGPRPHDDPIAPPTHTHCQNTHPDIANE